VQEVRGGYRLPSIASQNLLPRHALRRPEVAAQITFEEIDMKDLFLCTCGQVNGSLLVFTEEDKQNFKLEFEIKQAK
jgi:hypothetical protein